MLTVSSGLVIHQATATKPAISVIDKYLFVSDRRMDSLLERDCLINILSSYGIEPRASRVLDIGFGNGNFTLELGSGQQYRYNGVKSHICYMY